MSTKIELRITALQRSGQHAIIEWIMNQCPSHSIHLNNCAPDADPYEAYPDKTERARDKHLIAYNYESRPVREVCTDYAESKHDAWMGAVERRYDVIIIRDLFNNMASYKAHPFKHQSYKEAVRIWRDHAEAVLRGEPVFKAPLLPISYNKWVQDRGYREELADLLGLDFTDKGRDTLATSHRTNKKRLSSSFDGLEYESCASKMKVESRWEVFKDDDQYWEPFTVEDYFLSLNTAGPFEGCEAILEILEGKDS